ncbi:hypothetical protein UFOVP991_25 [uncultured Caudovirales phage]|uniref:Uncharacterized protein n=1 Tax=uncultured Caudovirales phage TaxID=2100421 RepID=A0A6J5RTD2_9CAUD|nr:hypothetical protein UFOVP991_25 [uncultured Caudovirales phage]CAB4182806.1 hypothetical protein UFOVP1076_25 [uncultured Caudovirales phage]CAB4197436.1 hypothetical protein UFOVP1314_8 [uncultured Caudovirales phage]CAB4211277.1 hypothetical protein UFOVP1427_2 [uncultured Caudovirales phage]CAB5237961.1 hypothetical protein UFOVP1523_6 [uncultured Caudovirales phage]
MNDKELVAFLDHYGHLRQPFGEQRGINSAVIPNLTISDQLVRDALESYQAFHSTPLEHIASGIFSHITSPITGELDKPTTILLDMARCQNPDYAAANANAEEAGSGNWNGCHGIGPFHCASVKFLNKPPDFLQPFMSTIWDRVVDAYSEIGLLFDRDDAAPSNIDISFVQPDGGWIGLAIVGTGQGCQDQIWARFDKNYKPANLVSEWTTLLKHELGHNCGLSHSQGGVMNPYIIPGLPVSWIGDVSAPLLRQRFGGASIPRKPTSRTLVLAWQLGTNEFEVIKTLDTDKPPTGIFG